HLQRTRLMLHLVDVLPLDESDIVANIKTINAELKAFSDELAAREQWLVFNKIDVMPEPEWQALVKQALRKLRWKGRWFAISAATHAGCDDLAEAAMQWVEAHVPKAEPVLSFEMPAEAPAAPVKRNRAAPRRDKAEEVPNKDLGRMTVKSTRTRRSSTTKRPLD
ncbi:MAG: GTPase ObgE, partial [Solimonas sp.]